MLTRFMVELRTTPQSKLAKGRSYQVLYRLGLQGGVCGRVIRGRVLRMGMVDATTH